MATEQFAQLVVIGSSAGGIESLGSLLSTLPRDFPAPIVIAQHIDPHRQSHLREVLSRRSTLPVHTIEGPTPLESGVVLVVPANRHVEVIDGEVILRADHGVGPMPSVDLLLSSAAPAYGEGLVAVILSGMGSDGAVGAREVKEHGGTVIIEDPSTANFPGMPQSLAPTTVDIVADVSKLGSVLYELLAGGMVPPRPETERAMDVLLADLRERSGIDFSSYKRPTIQRRLRRRMAATDVKTVEEYLAYIDANPEEYQRLINSFLIKVTDFFRDAELFERLRSGVLPDIIEFARHHGKEIRIWSAGCATGEEAYSLGILLCECLGQELDDFHIRIFATDLDDDAVNFARRGIYQASALAGIDPDLVARYFTEDDGQYEIRKRVRALMVFGQHDLGQRAPFPHIDLILCRNVLIYFTTELQRRALQLFAFALRTGGYLVMGKAESTSPLGELFQIWEPNLKIYRRHGDRMLIPPARIAERPAAPVRSLIRRSPTGRELRRPEPSPARAASDRFFEDIFRQLPLGLVVIDARYEVQSINATARQLLGIHAAAVGDDFVHLAQNVPSRGLRTAIDRTFRGGIANTLPEMAIDDPTTGQTRYLDLICYPHNLDPERQPLTSLIVVSDVTERVGARRQADAALADAQREREQVSAQVQRLLETNNELLDANAELTSVNMELRSANEEFLVNNEEVQAATEEVETLNEELQATNEELETLNEELQATVEELNTTNDDLQARTADLQELAAVREEQRRQADEDRAQLESIVGSLGSGLLVVDAEGKPVMANPVYESMFGPATADLQLADGDGRPLSDAETPLRRAAAGEPFRMEFTRVGADGQRRWYEALGGPLRGKDGANGLRAGNGAVLIVSDITDRSLLRMQQEFLVQISHELRTPLTSLHGFLQLLDGSFQREANEDPRRRQVELATQQARRLARLIEELVDLSRLQTGKLTLHEDEVDLVELVRTTVELARPLAEGRTLNVEVARVPVRTRADAGRLEQMLMNLVTHAIAHTRPTDRIDVRLRGLPDEAELQVQDTGPGIPESELPSLFTRYFQDAAEADGGRGGLGLFIVKQFVEAHDGQVSVQSTVGQGTTFTVRLPLKR
ncbi:MAG: PAS domain-containing protein [Chloroflexi bacterium]|nr:PAS domain-containing protein [Chloroflexota bacterium]